MIDRDLTGAVIDQPRKASKSVEIDGKSRFCGHRFMLRQKLYGDKKCLYCGKWFHWSQEDASKWLKNENIDPHNVDTVLEPLHCGNSHCDDYHKAYLSHQQKKQIEYVAIQEERMMSAFKRFKKTGII